MSRNDRRTLNDWVNNTNPEPVKIVDEVAVKKEQVRKAHLLAGLVQSAGFKDVLYPEMLARIEASKSRMVYGVVAETGSDAEYQRMEFARDVKVLEGLLHWIERQLQEASTTQQEWGNDEAGGSN